MGVDFRQERLLGSGVASSFGLRSLEGVKTLPQFHWNPIHSFLNPEVATRAGFFDELGWTLSCTARRGGTVEVGTVAFGCDCGACTH